MKRLTLIAGALAGAILSIFPAAPVYPQMNESSMEIQLTLPTTPIQRGTLVPGILNREDPIVSGLYVEAFQFSGTEGDPVFIHLVGSFDQTLPLNPYLIVISPAGRVVARTGAAPNTVNAYVLLRLGATGNYTILVSGAPVSEPGRYTLTVQRAEPSLVEGLTAPLTSEMGEAALEAQRSPER